MFKSKKFFYFILLIILLVILLLSIQTNTDNNPNSIEAYFIDYDNKIENFIELDVDSFNSKINDKDTFFLYLGRKTCPACREITNYLYDIITKDKIDIYYLNTEDTKNNEDLKRIRKKFTVDTVPQILFFKKGELISKYEDNLDEFIEKK